MKEAACPVSEAEFVEACKKVEDVTMKVEEISKNFRSAILRGAIFEAGASIPVVMVGGMLEVLLSCGVVAANIVPYIYSRCLGKDAMLLRDRYLALQKIRIFCRDNLDRALCLSRDTCVSITPLASGNHLVSIRR